MDHSASDHKAFIREMFRDILGNESFDEQSIRRYFSPNYVQRVDGKTLNFSEFLEHVRELKRTVARLRFTFEEMVAEDEKVMEIHLVEGEKRGGGSVAARLFALWVIEGGKIVRCDEISRLERGTAEDRDLGSRMNRQEQSS